MKLPWPAICCLMLITGVQADEDDSPLQEVHVFAPRARAATKTDTELVEIPQSISVVTANQIEERGALNYQDVFRYAAGIDTERYGDDTREDDFSARGFALVQYLDELNRTPHALYGSRTEVYTLERSEVLRGPSAVLYGAGSAGGLLNAVSKRPQFKFGGELGAEVGTRQRRQVQGDVTGPLNESGTLAGRLVGVLRNGELQSKGEPNDKYVLLPSLTWRPSAATDITLIGLYQKEHLGTQTYLPLSKTLNVQPGVRKLPIDFFVGEPDFNHMRTDFASGTLLVSHQATDWLTLESHSRYSNQRVDYREVYGSYYGGVDPFLDAGHTLLAREFYALKDDYQILNTDNHARMTFNTGPLAHQILLGVDYTRFVQHRKEGFSCRGVTDGSFNCFKGGSPPPLDVYNPQYGQPFDFGFTNAYTTRSTQLGVYVQDQMKYGEHVSLVLGGRRDRATSATNTTSTEVNHATTARAGLIVEVVKGVSPYVGYSESFEPVFGADVNAVPYKPLRGRQYEGGVKWQPLPNSLVTVSYFDIAEKNFLTSDPTNIQNYIQAGEVGSKGVEFEGIVNTQSGFGVTLNYSHLRARVLRGTSSHPAGDRVEDLPNDLASLWASQQVSLFKDWAVRVGAGVRYVGEKIDFYQHLKTPAVTLADASIELTHDQWRASVNINNLFDREFYASCSAWSPPDGVCSPGTTRNVVATLSRRF